MLKDAVIYDALIEFMTKVPYVTVDGFKNKPTYFPKVLAPILSASISTLIQVLLIISFSRNRRASTGSKSQFFSNSSKLL